MKRLDSPLQPDGSFSDMSGISDISDMSDINVISGIIGDSGTEAVAPGDAIGSKLSDAYVVGRRVALAGLGVIFIGVDQVQGLFVRATKRGQLMEADMQREFAAASERSTEAMSTGLASLLNRFPGVRIAYKPPPDQPPAPHETGKIEAKTLPDNGRPG